MEAGNLAKNPRRGDGRVPLWVLGITPLVLIAIAITVFAALGSPGLSGRGAPPAEEIAIENVTLTPGKISLKLRNDGPDPVQIAQATVNDAFAPISGADHEIGRLRSATVTLTQPWISGERYAVTLVTSTGATVTHEIPAAVETPSADLGFFGLMILLGLYVGVIPIALGMLWLPWVRRIPGSWLQVVMAFTVGLLGFLAIDAALEGIDLVGQGPQVFGGIALVALGGIAAFLLLSALSVWLKGRRRHTSAPAATKGSTLALLVAVGIGLHNLSEGLAIGAAYAIGSISLGAFLVIGFALHNTTEGLAIVAPAASQPPALRRLLALGLIAGTPAILGACLGALAFNPSLASLLLGVGAGAIVQVIVQLVPSIRDKNGQLLNPHTVGGLLLGMAVMYGTSLMVAL